MNQTPPELTADLRLLAEFYDDQPYAIVWLRPVWSESREQIDDFEYTYCNSEGLKYLNLEPEQLKGLFISKASTLTDNLRKSVLDEMRRVFETGEKSETTFFNPALNKYVRVLRTRFRGGVLTTVKDLTQENHIVHRLEEQTREIQAQKTLLDNILQHSSSGISVGEMIRDNSGKIVDIRTILVNESACQFIGIPKELYLSKTGGELDPNFVGSPYFQLCVQCMETGEPFITQYFLEAIERWLEVTVSKMNEDHQIYIFTDVTPIKKAQLATERTAAQLQTIINRTQSGIFTLSPVRDEKGDITDFRFVLVNHALAAYVNQEPENLIGTLASDWFTGYKKNGLFELYRETYQTGHINRFDFHYNEDGIDVWIDVMCSNFDGELLVTFIDYTPTKKLQLELQKTVEELKQSNESLEEFAYAASHDLQEPLRKIHTFSDRLRQELTAQLNSVQQMMFERIQSATLRMRQLIEDLLAYAQVSRQSGQFTQVDLNVVVEAVLQDLEESINESGAIVKVERLPVISGDERQLRQLFQNLVGNALKYRRPDVPPLIKLTCTILKGNGNATKPYYQVEVSDNGIGFEQQYAQSIFEVFHRLHGRAEYEGTGIGLAIVQRVVQNHSGYITAEGKPGAGATFTIQFPA